MNHLFSLRDHLINGIDFFNEYNCDIDNISVFDYVSLQEENPYCAVISHSFSDRDSGQRGNFQNEIFEWRILLNFFCALRGSREEQALAIQDGYAKTREIIDYLCSDFTWNNVIMDGSIHSVNTPMTYGRNNRDDYLMIGITILVKEALNG